MFENSHNKNENKNVLIWKTESVSILCESHR